MTEIDELIERAQKELGASRTLIRDGYFAQALSRSYYGAFYAAEAALLAVGQVRSKHSGVISGFGRHVVKEAGLDPRFAGLLRDLFEGRIDADYGDEPTPKSRAERAVAEADELIGAVRDWLAQR